MKELKLLADHNVDAIVLARYMQILSSEFVKKYPNKIINIVSAQFKGKFRSS